jgi:hypothetical protein
MRKTMRSRSKMPVFAKKGAKVKDVNAIVLE